MRRRLLRFAAERHFQATLSLSYDDYVFIYDISYVVAAVCHAKRGYGFRHYFC